MSHAIRQQNQPRERIPTRRRKVEFKFDERSMITSDDLDDDPGIVLEYHPAPDEEDDPIIIINPTLTLTARMSPPEVVSALSGYYGNDWIMQLFEEYLNRRREMIA